NPLPPILPRMAPWLSAGFQTGNGVVVQGGTAPTAVAVSVNAESLEPRTYTGSVTVLSNGITLGVVTVTVEIVNEGQAMIVSPGSLCFQCGFPQTQIVSVKTAYQFPL